MRLLPRLFCAGKKKKKKGSPFWGFSEPQRRRCAVGVRMIARRGASGEGLRLPPTPPPLPSLPPAQPRLPQPQTKPVPFSPNRSAPLSPPSSAPALRHRPFQPPQPPFDPPGPAIAELRSRGGGTGSGESGGGSERGRLRPHLPPLLSPPPPLPGSDVPEAQKWLFRRTARVRGPPYRHSP